MDDLISRAAAMEVIDAVKDITLFQSDKVLCGKIYSQIKDLPTVYAVPVVRCKDCKYAQHDVMYDDLWCDGIIRQTDWYCADGERREYAEN